MTPLLASYRSVLPRHCLAYLSALLCAALVVVGVCGEGRGQTLGPQPAVTPGASVSGVVGDGVAIGPSTSQVQDAANLTNVLFPGLAVSKSVNYAGTTIAKLGSITGGSGYTVSSIISTIGTITGGSLYTDGTYTAVPLTGGTGSGATCTITIFGGAVISCTAISGGSGYLVGDSLSVNAASVGGTGSGFSTTVATTAYNGVPLTGGTGSGATANIKVSAGGAVNSVALVNHGTGYAANDTLSAAAANIGGTGSGFSIPVTTVGSVSSPTNAWFWQSNPNASDNPGGVSATGTCADTNVCTTSLFVTGRDTVDASAPTNGFFAYIFTDNAGGAGTKGAHHTGQFNFSLVATPDNEGTSRTYTALNTVALATANANGTNGTPQGALFGFNDQAIIGGGGTYFLQDIGIETDLSVRAGGSTADLIGHQIVLDSLHTNSASRYNSAYLLAAQNNTVPKLDRMLTDGGYSGFPGLSTGATWFSCFPNGGSGNCGAITNFADLSKYTSISGNIINGPAGTFHIDGSFNVVANTLSAGATGSTSAPDLILSVCGSQCGLYAPASGQLAFTVGNSNVMDYAITTAGQWTIAGGFRSGNLNLSGNTTLTAPATRTLQIGIADAAAPGAQTLQVQSVSAGNGNTAAATWTITGSKSNGSGAGGDINFQTTASVAGSGVQNSAVTALTIKGGTQNIVLPVVPTGTPAASLCIDASNNIIKKTTTGSCI